MNKNNQYAELISKLYYIKNFMQNEVYEVYSDGSKNPKEYEISLVGTVEPLSIGYNNIFSYITNKKRIIFDIDLDYNSFEKLPGWHSLIAYTEWNCITINLEEFSDDIISMNDMELILRYGKLDHNWITYTRKYIDAIYQKFIQLSEDT